jgi:hypothetical protein
MAVFLQNAWGTKRRKNAPSKWRLLANTFAMRAMETRLRRYPCTALAVDGGLRWFFSSVDVSGRL